MRTNKLRFRPVLAVLAGAALLSFPSSSVLAAEPSGSDYAFNEMVLEMAGRDTGSMWFDYYVEAVNQEIAAKETEEPYGAAGPSGSLTGFDEYVSGFVSPDTGSMWFDTYVDSVQRLLKDKGY